MLRIIAVLVLLSACQRSNDSYISDILLIEEDTVSQNNEHSFNAKQYFVGQTDSIYGLLDLVTLSSLDGRILIDVKYATTDNFMNVQLYDTISSIYLNKEVAERLSKCQDLLDSLKPGFHLLVFDGIRPLQVQQEMWEALDSIPVYRRGKFVSNPAKGSVHNYGAAVDLTIVDAEGNQLDMGAGYDDFREIAFPSSEYKFLASGELSQNQVNNRKLLRKVMRSQGFRNIPSEWWHFNAFSRVTVSRKYKRLLTETGREEWFRLSYPKKDTVSI